MTDPNTSQDMTAEAFAAMVARTLAADRARLAYTQDSVISLDDTKKSRETLEQSLIWRSIFLTAGLTWRMAKFLFKLRFKDWDFRHSEAEGYIEPSQRRYQIDFGSYAESYVDGELYGGLSGRALSTLHPWRATSKQPFALWCLGVLTGATHVTRTGESLELHGSICSELSVTADLARASELTDFALHVPFAPGFRELSRLPFSVWIDAAHIRRIRFTRPNEAILTFEFWDYGVDTSGLSWTHLPDFGADSD